MMKSPQNLAKGEKWMKWKMDWIIGERAAMAKQAAKRMVPIMFAILLMFAVLPSTAQAAPKLKLNKTKATVYVGKTVTLKVSGASGNVTWTSKNKKIATVKKVTSKSAKVTVKKAGKTTITAKIGKKSATCSIIAKNPYLNVKKKTLSEGQAFQLKLTGAKIRSCKSDSPSVAKVSKSGKVTAKKAGKVVISVTASNRKVYKCTFTVKGKNSQTDHEDLQPKDLSEVGGVVYLSQKVYSYTGKALEPDVIRVFTAEDRDFLLKGIDYTVGYSNNINAGKAQVIVTGIGDYKGKIIKEFEIEKARQDITAKLENETVYVGKTGKINVSGAYGDLKFSVSKENVAKVGSDGTITGLKTGITDIYLTASGDRNHYGPANYYVGKVGVMHEEASAYGFDTRGWGKEKYKICASYDSIREEDGSNTYRARFRCNADEKWLDENIIFEVEDVTPKAYAKVFEDLGVAYEKPEITVESGDGLAKFGTTIEEPFAEDGKRNNSELSSSGKSITIKAGAGVRAVKLAAKKGDTVLDFIYLGSTGSTQNPFDVELYKKIRQKVEAQIWTDGMSNLEKLKELAVYIKETTHYPETDVTSKEYNPIFWENWAVDDKELHLSMFGDSMLNKLMVFQGGIMTCHAVRLLKDAAVEDLGLPYLYDGDKISPGEGVWLAAGSESSNPGVADHETLVYKSAEEEEVFIDAQGLSYSASSGKASCEAHGCQEKIISLK